MTTIRHTQQKSHPLMPFENNGTLQKWHMTKTPPEIEIMTPTKMVSYKNGTPCKKIPKGYPICQGLSWVIFKRKFLNSLYDSDSWSWDFKVEFFPLQNDIPGNLSCLMVVGAGSISRMLVVLQKTNNVVVRCHLCWVPFLGGGIFDERSPLFVTLCQWVP